MQTALTIIINKELGLSFNEAENHSEILINAFDLEHRIVFWNKKAEAYFGITCITATGNRLEDIVPYVNGNDKMHLLDRALRGTPLYIAKQPYDKAYGTYEQWVLPVKKEGRVIAALNIVKSL